MHMDDLKPLTKEEILQSLSQIPGWEYKEDKIFKQFVFPDFPSIIAFIQKLTPHFQKVDHHPDIHIYYTKVTFELQRFSVGGKVTPRDIETAKYIEEEFEKMNKQ